MTLSLGEFKKHVREPISKALTMVPVDDMYYTLDYDASILEQGGDNEVLASAHGLDPNENNNLMLQVRSPLRSLSRISS